jgi:transposase
MPKHTPTRLGIKGQCSVLAVDVAKRNHMLMVQGPDGAREKPRRIANSAAGFGALLQHAQTARRRWPGVPLVVALEPTGHYWLPLAYWLQARDLPVLTVNPAHTKRAKELEDNSPAKTDEKDVRVIADLAAMGRARPCRLQTGVYATLRALARLRARVAADLTAVTNQLHQLCDQLFPELLPCFGGDLRRTSCRRLLAVAPTPAAVQALGVERLTALLRGASRGRYGAARATQLLAAAATSIGLREGTAPRVTRLHYLLEEEARLRGYRRALEQQQAAALRLVPYAAGLLQFRGLGVVTVATLLGETGDLQGFRRARQLLKHAGLNLYELRSGEHQGQRRLTKRGRPGLRRILYMAALRLVKRGAPLHGYYHRLRARLAGTAAVVAVMRKLLRVVHALVHSGQAYDALRLAA